MQSVERTLLLSATSTNSDSPTGGAPLGGSGPATRDSTSADICAPRGADICALGESGYRPGLATFDLVAEIRGLLATERRAERLVCRYLADLADRIQARQDVQRGVYADELDAARHFFGLGARDTRERVRVGRALRKLPEIERAFIDGELAYSRVREVTRVATVHNEPDWLELARRLDMRSLERRVAAERDSTDEQSDRHGERRPGERARTQWMGPGRVRVTFELSVEAWTVLGRAMREARRAGTAGPSDGDALEAVARAALSVPRDPSDAGDGALPHQWPTWAENEGDGGAADPGRSIAEGPECGEATRDVRLTELGTATQGGSAASGVPDRQIGGQPVGIGFAEQAGELGSRLLGVMGRSRGWTLDALTESSGLSAQQVCVALTLLELGGRVRQRAFAFDPA